MNSKWILTGAACIALTCMGCGEKQPGVESDTNDGASKTPVLDDTAEKTKEAVNKAVKDLQAAIPEIKKDLTAANDKANAVLAEQGKELGKVAGDIKAAAPEIEKELKAQIAELNESLKDLNEQAKEKIKGAAPAIKEELKAANEEANQALQKKIEMLKEQLKKLNAKANEKITAEAEAISNALKEKSE